MMKAGRVLPTSQFNVDGEGDTVNDDHSEDTIRTRLIQKDNPYLIIWNYLREWGHMILSIRALIVFSFLVLTIAFSATVIAVMNYEMTKFHQQLSDQKRTTSIHRIEDELNNRRTSIESITKITARMIQNGAIVSTNFNALSKHYLDLFALEPHVQQVLYTDATTKNTLGYTRLLEDPGVYQLFYWKGVSKPKAQVQIVKVLNTDTGLLDTPSAKKTITRSILLPINLKTTNFESYGVVNKYTPVDSKFVNSLSMVHSYYFYPNPGCLQVTYELASLSQHIQSYKVEVQVIVVNTKGEIVLYPDNISDNVLEKATSLVMKSYVKNESGKILEGNTSEKYYLTYKVVNVSDDEQWIIIALETGAASLAVIKESREHLLIIAVLAILLSIVIAFIISYLINRPIGMFIIIVCDNLLSLI
jgi:hypothetical protein